MIKFDSTVARHFIDGEWCSDGEIHDAINPATGEVLGSYYDAGSRVAVAAISAARRAYEQTRWATDHAERARALSELADAVEANADELIEALSLENGKISSEAEFEISLCGPTLRYNASLALTDVGEAAQVRESVLSMALKEPLGVAGIIVPWNSPVVLAIRSFAPALAAGCSVAIKMPAQTALTNSLLARVIESVPSLPAGVLNLFTESGDAGARHLVQNPDVDVISYTGSTAVGSEIMAAAGEHLKPVSLELGGKTPMIVFDDADLDTCVPALVAAITTFAGQFCMTGSRVLAQVGIAGELKQRLACALRDVRTGPASEPDSQMGPMIDKAAVDRVDKLLSAASDVEWIVRGGPLDGPGAFYAPTLVGVSDLRNPLVQEEIFGPVATFEVFDREQTAIERANATRYGLSASVWTRDGARSLRVSRAVQAGTVWTNTWGQVFDQFEEGGFKSSGIGRLRGKRGLEAFQEVKHVVRTTD